MIKAQLITYGINVTVRNKCEVKRRMVFFFDLLVGLIPLLHNFYPTILVPQGSVFTGVMPIPSSLY